MRVVTRLLPVVVLVMLSAFAPVQSDNVEFSCVKTHKATNTCHFNFKIDGQKYRFVDIGCRYKGKSKEVIDGAREGSIALAKDWKIDCAEGMAKADKTTAKSTSVAAKKESEGF